MLVKACDYRVLCDWIVWISTVINDYSSHYCDDCCVSTEAEAEASYLATLFHLEKRLEHTGAELSGGQKRKLSVAIAVCGGSKFVVLDEPTAGKSRLPRSVSLNVCVETWSTVPVPCVMYLVTRCLHTLCLMLLNACSFAVSHESPLLLSRYGSARTPRTLGPLVLAAPGTHHVAHDALHGRGRCPRRSRGHHVFGQDALLWHYSLSGTDPYVSIRV